MIRDDDWSHSCFFFGKGARVSRVTTRMSDDKVNLYLAVRQYLRDNGFNAAETAYVNTH